jgi:hypothetical protein
MNDRIKGVVAGTAAGLAGVAGAAAQSRLQDKFFPGPSTPDDVASAGNGGVATSSASGGAIGTGDINSGGNAGNAVGIGDTSGGGVSASGGSMTNTTDLGLSANGGTAIADASGGNYNLAFVS